MNTNVIAAVVVAVTTLGAAVALAALHTITGGEALAVVTLVAGGGVGIGGAHAALTASAGGESGTPTPFSTAGRQDA